MQDQIITPELVSLDVDYGASPGEVIEHLAGAVATSGRATDKDQLAAEAQAREQKSGTGVPGGVAIPHCRSEAVTTPTLAFARLARPVDFSGPDGEATLVFLIAAPAGGGKEHLKILSKLARALVRKDFLEGLRGAEDEAAIVELVLGVVNAPPKKKKKPAAEAPASEATDDAAKTGAAATAATAGATGAAGAAGSAAATDRTADSAPQATTHIVAITACPTGIAHTYMAADSLTQEAEGRSDIELVVETQGSSAVTPVEPQLIDQADAVIFATDVGVKDRERFAGKPVVESGVKRAINEPKAMIDEAIAAAQNPRAHRVAAAGGAAQESESTEDTKGLGWGKRIQQAVMTGVSYMVPFVAAGGLLIALGFLLAGYDVGHEDGWQAIVLGHSLTDLPGNIVEYQGQTYQFARSGLLLYLGAVCFATGQMSMGFIVAALSGYIAYALAGRPGIAPGFVGGAVSVLVGAGFLGGLVTGILAGLVAMWIGSWKVPRFIGSLMPVVIIPLLSSLTVGAVMFLLLGRPLKALMEGLQNGLASMSGSSAILLGILIGLMMCSDLGGPINKAAYLFGTAGLSTGDEASLRIMAAVMAAGMVPPIALSLASFLRGKLFTPAERENGKSAWLLGLSFVTEGAIPFAAADPLRVIPSMMLGGATTGALIMGLGVTSQAPHGGIFVIFAIAPWWAFLLAVIAGVVVGTAAVIAVKQFWPSKATKAVNAHAAAKKETAAA